MVKGRKGVVAAVTAAVLASICLLILGLVFFAGFAPGEPPVIYGVQERIVLYMDDDIRAALDEGVYAADQEGSTFPVEVSLYDESGEQVSEYRPGTYRLVYSCKSAEVIESVLILCPEDKEPPVITGVRDLTVTVGGTVSYRDGVTVTDNMDENVPLRVDAEQVNLTQAGTYPVTYSAEDTRGNRTRITVKVLVEEAPVQEPLNEGPDEPGEEANESGDAAAEPEPSQAPSRPANTVVVPVTATQESLDELAWRILGQIITPDMTQRQMARAIFDYVNRNIRYVETYNKASWITGAYVGFTQRRGDCFNYFACSKELLTLAGIPNIDLRRVGGNSDHYWQLVNVGDGWYHFDACPHPVNFPVASFLMTETDARQYTAQCSIWTNYYVYDYAACPVTVVGTPEDEIQQPEQPPAEELPGEQPPAEESPGEQPPAEELPGEQPPAEELPGEQPPAEESPGEQPPAEESPGEQPPAPAPPPEEAPETESE